MSQEIAALEAEIKEYKLQVGFIPRIMARSHTDFSIARDDSIRSPG
jgi:hypothetical protein